MKKLVAGLLATAVCLSLCACHASDRRVAQITEAPEDSTASIALAQPLRFLNPTPEETQKQDTEPVIITVTEDDWAEDVSEEAIFLCEDGSIQGVDAMVENPLYPRLKELMGFDVAQLDLDDAYSSVEKVVAYFADHQLITPNYTFEMDDGSKLQLPMTYQELCDAGWQPEYEIEYDGQEGTVPGDCYDWNSMINKDGKTLGVEIGNYSASPVALADTTITQLQMGYDYTEGCSVNGIRLGATVAEVIEAFGLPFECSYYQWEDGYENFTIYYIDDINYSHIMFDFDPATGLLSSINYCVLLHPSDRPA